MERHTQLLSQFTDYVLAENGCRWRGMEPFLDTKDLRSTWADYLAQKSASFRQKEQKKGWSGGYNNSNNNQRGFGQGNSNVLPSVRLGVPANLLKDDICVRWNLGRCVRPAQSCFTFNGRALRHVCNFRLDPTKDVPCGKNHMSINFHK